MSNPLRIYCVQHLAAGIFLSSWGRYKVPAIDLTPEELQHELTTVLKPHLGHPALSMMS
jgi:hypothetical protein